METGTIEAGGKQAELTKNELRILYYPFENDGVICTRADLIEYLWDNRLYSDTSYHNEELKSLTRYRFDKVKERAKLKSSVSRLVCILFPELERLVPTLHMASVYWHPSMLCFVNFQVQMLLQMHISQGFPTYSLIVRKADMEKILLSCFVTLQEVLSVLIRLPSL